MKKLLVLLSFIIYFSLNAKCDTLTVNGHIVSIDRPSPLEQHPSIKNLRYQLRDYQSLCFDDDCMGYNAYWEITGKQLYLKSIRSCRFGNKNLVARLDTLFPNVLPNKMIKADWVNGELWSPVGRPVHWSDSRQLFTYKHETCYTIKNGKLISTKEFDYPTSHESIFRNDSYLVTQYIYQHINWSQLPELKLPAQFVFIAVKTGATENANSIIYYKTANEEAFNIEAKRVLESMPLGVYYWHGQVYNESFMMKISFTEEMKKKFAPKK